jgi:peptidoglycan/LPS O-acetylase OafA/YrhL
MDHPNAIYFQLAAHAWLVLAGALFLAGFFNKGPYKSIDVSPSWVKIIGVIGIFCVILGLIALYTDIGRFLGG